MTPQDMEAIREALSDLVDACYEPDEGRGGAWRVCTKCNMSYHRDDPPGLYDGHMKGCVVQAAEVALANELKARSTLLSSLTAAGEGESDREILRKAAKEATNGWACFARTKREHAEIARLHGVIDAVVKGWSQPSPADGKPHAFGCQCPTCIATHFQAPAADGKAQEPEIARRIAEIEAQWDGTRERDERGGHIVGARPKA